MLDSVDKVKEHIEKKCSSVPSNLLKIDTNMDSKNIREKILQLVGHISYFNELHDRAKFAASVQKRKLELIRAKALFAISKDEILSKLAVPVKEQYVEVYEISIDNKKTTYNEEHKLYDAYLYAVDRFGSLFEDIRIAIMALQSVLSYDREEMKNIS